MRRFGAYSPDVDAFDPESRTIDASAVTISGDTAPPAPTTWWPWIIAGGVLAALWWITREDKLHGPLVGGAG